MAAKQPARTGPMKPTKVMIIVLSKFEVGSNYYSIVSPMSTANTSTRRKGWGMLIPTCKSS